MRKYIILALGILMVMPTVYSQAIQTWIEDFDGTVSFTARPSNYGGINTLYSTSGLNSYRGRLPNSFGDSVVLETPFYDLRTLSHDFGQLRFRHICKIDPADIVRFEYRINGLYKWEPVPAEDYKGEMASYVTTGFSARSYPLWEVNDVYKRPGMNWWKEEVFDLSFAKQSEVQFRFVIKRGKTLGTQFSYGWLIDDFRVFSDTAAMYFPTISLVNPVQDTIITAGPFDITARTSTGDFFPIANVSLEYTKLCNGVVTTHSMPMNNLGQNIWRTTIPVQELNAKIVYSAVATDIEGNKNNAVASFVLVKDPSKQYDSNAVSVVSLDVPTQNTTIGGVETPLEVTIRNEGEYNLTSANIHWSINGVSGTPYTWSGDLIWGITDDQIEIGKYTPRENQFDTIVIWIEEINNIQGTYSDSLTTRLYGCEGAMSGTVFINPDTNIILKTLELLEICGVGGDITISLGNGKYYEDIDLSNFDLIMGNHYLTITSTGKNRDSVILYPANGQGILLNNTNNITIDRITIDASALQIPTVHFTGSCSNIVISHCALLGNTSGNTAALSPSPIEKIASGTGFVSNVHITNNFIKGGYYGIRLYGGVNGNFGKNIVIDSNVLTHQYYYGMYLYYNEQELLYNEVYYNKDNTTRLLNNSWRGIQTSNSEGNIIGNRIYQLSGLTTSVGLFFVSFNQYRKTPGIVSNNEIIMNTSGTNTGVYLSTGSKAIFAHNSVYVSALGASVRAIHVTGSANNKFTIKNNLLAVNDNAGFAIYMVDTVYARNYDIDYNNYYVYSSSGNIGYIGSNRKTLADWQAAIQGDIHSMDKQPFFIDSSLHLGLSSYTGLGVPYLPEVSTDINNNVRSGLTAIGAYEYSYTANDALLTEFIDWRTGTLTGDKDSVKVILRNGSTTPLTHVEIGWNFNGTNKPAILWNGNLSKGETDTVTLDEITYSFGMNTLKAWIKDFVSDEYHLNDTIYVEDEFCDTMFNGTYVVGATGTFSTVNEAMDKINICGINGPVVLTLEDGVYPPIDLSKYDEIQTTATNTITITSLTGNRDNVIINHSSTSGILLGDINNIIIDGITIDGSSAERYGIQFVEACSNIVITGCNIKAHPTTTASASCPVYKGSGTNLADNIIIKNNIISGGYYSIYFYAGNGVGEYGKGMVIDSNTITGAYYYTVYVYFADIDNLSHNTILSRSANTTTTWYGLYLSSVNAKINANKIRQLSTGITSPTAIYLATFNVENTTIPGLISNNEIIVSSSGTGYGINASGAAIANIINNSIYVGGAGTGRAISVTNNAASILAIKNNNLTVESATAYPLYLANVALIPQCDIDYNNYYSTGNIGYAGAAIADLLAWNTAVPLDLHSTDYQPNFVDIYTNLRIQNIKGFRCPRMANTLEDLDGIVRKPMTSKGAYHTDAHALDVSPNVFVDLPATSSIGTNFPVIVTFVNAGSDTLSSFDIGWKMNSVIKDTVWHGSLAPEGQVTLILDNISIQAGTNPIMVWTSHPNQGNDMDVSNDTLRGSVVACNAPLTTGVYLVGDDQDFPGMEAVQTVLNMCGIDGDVTFSILPKVYNTPLIIENITGVNDTNSLSFISQTGNAEDVVLKGVTIGANMQNITLKNLTIEGRYSNAGIRLNTPIKDITVDGCTIISNPSATANSTTTFGTYGIYLNGNATDTVRNIRIVNNNIDGGYGGVYLSGGVSASYGQVTDIWIDSNTLTNQGQYHVYLQYSNASSISHNTILSKTGEMSSYWYAMYLTNVNVSFINANRIKQRSTLINYPMAVYLTNVNNLAPQPTLITNNEIYIYKKSGSFLYFGIGVFGNTNVKLFFNSIFADGTECSAVEMTNNSNIRATLKYNNLFAADSCYPIYFVRTVHQTGTFDLGYNNYYSTRFIGGANDLKFTTIEDWKNEVTYDKTSISIQPHFIDSTTSLEVSNPLDFLCAAIPEVKTDINGDERIGVTTMGCYTQFVPTVNLTLESILDFGKHEMTGDKDTVRVILRNGGLTPVTSTAISYDFNGATVSLPLWTGYLETGDADTVTLGELQYQSGWNNLSVWIDSLPGLTDMYSGDDAIEVTKFFCDSIMQGSYIVGSSSNADFSTISEAVESMYFCGISAPVTFMLEDTLYLEHVRLESPIIGSSAVNTVTFTSYSGNASDVTIQRPDDTKEDLAPFMLREVANIIISNLTLSGRSPIASTYTYAKGVILKNNCENIEINGCVIILPKFGTPTSTSSNYSGINKPSTTESVSNIRILNNTIDGGVYGIYLVGTTTTMMNNIYIADNNIPLTDKGGVYIQYADSVTVINNILYQRNEAVITSLQTFQGIYLSSTNKITVLKNKIKAARGLYGIYLATINANLSVSDGLIANNEIMTSVYETTLTTARQGIYAAANTKTRIYHNSVFMEGPSVGYGLHAVSSAGTELDIRNNILAVTNQGASYPIYFAAAADAIRSNFAYNNYYTEAGTNLAVGFIGAAKITLADWTDIIYADTQSVSVKPIYEDVSAGLNLQSNYDLGCPVLPVVPVDINDSARANTTNMGAYHYVGLQNDVLPYEILSPVGNIYDSTDVIISVQSLGMDTLKNLTFHWAVNGVLQTPFVWNGNLASNKISAPITIGKMFSAQRINELVIWTSNPNTVTDNNVNNDTIRSAVVVCSTLFSGTYTIGPSSPDFQTMGEAVELLCGCGVGGPTVFELENGTFLESVTIEGPILGSSAVNTVTFTSEGKHYDSTTIQRIGNRDEAYPAIILENVSNFKFTHLKISGRSAQPEPAPNTNYAVAIILRDGCENVEFSNCYLENPTFTSAVNSTNYSVISRTIGSSIPISDIRFLNNIISGGAYGIYHSGSGTGVQKDNNILIQGNEFINMDKYGIRFGTAENVRILNNTITQRPFAGVKQSFYGIAFSGISGNSIIQANRIKADTIYNAIELASSSAALVANNEIIVLKAGTASSGISAAGLSGQTTRIINNSILIAANGKATSVYSVRGVYLASTNNYELKNNHIVTLDSMSVPVYLGAYAAARVDINSNNYYNPYHVGYITTLRTTLAAWRTTVTGDIYSVSKPPVYDNLGVTLKLADTVGLSCTTIDEVNTDITGLARYGRTLIGAYSSSPLTVDAAILDITNIPTFGTTGEKYSPAITLKNFGTTPVTELIIECTVNGVLPPAYTKTWTGTLGVLSDTTILLDTLTALLGKNNVKVWISSVNALGSDEYLRNDTVLASFDACDSASSGSYTVGTINGNFASVMGALSTFKECGVKGDITLRLEKGIYKEIWNLEDLDFMNNYMLTITSLDNHKDSVVLQPQGGTELVGIILKNTNNITFRRLTIDAASKAQKGIQFTGACDNVTIDSCNILASPTETGTAFAAIYKATSTGIVNNITITNNVINGGYYGMYFYGGTGTGARGNKIRVDSNTFTNSYFYSVHLYNANATVANNTIQSRNNSTATWYGIYFYNSIGKINANRIYHRGAAATVHGIYCSYTSSTDADIYTVVSNNEIIVTATGTGTACNGIYGTSSKISILNNSILVKGTTAASRGISMTGAGATYGYVAKNNNIVMQSPIAYPIHLGDASYGPQWDINYNNYVASQYVGLVATATYPSLALWNAVVSSDSLSISEDPIFIDTTLNLELAEIGGLKCPRHRDALHDITGIARGEYTTMGAYSKYITEQDLELVDILSPSNSGDLCSPAQQPVRYLIRNNGSIDCNLAEDNLELYFSMTGPVSFDTILVLNEGILKQFSTTIIELKDILDVSYSGDYVIEAWIATNLFDTIHANDTLRMTYRNTKIALPFDNDFSMPDLTNLTVESILRDSVWQVELDTNNTMIKPYYGTGMLMLKGEIGTISRISTGQLELNRTQQPVLEFWYAHDNSNPEQENQIDVRLTLDGGATYTTLFNIMQYDPTITSPTWKKYMVDLSPYQDSSCAIISFEGYSYGGAQYIDRIVISSNQDLSVSKSLITSYAVCSLEEKEWKAVITNKTGQNIDFDKAENNTELVIEVNHEGTLISKNTYPLTGLLEGLSSDTITDSPKVNLTKGTYIVTSYLTKSIDNTPENDIWKDTIVINPDFSVQVEQISSGNANCLAGETPVWQEVSITNTGNMDLQNIGLILQIDTGNLNQASYITIRETCTDAIHTGQNITYRFNTPYSAPWQTTYYAGITAYLLCDSSLANGRNEVVECVDTRDLYIISIDNPSGASDAVGTTVNVTTTLHNRADNDFFSNSNITVLVEDSKGVQTALFTENLPTIGTSATISHTFTRSYTVPNDSVYYLTVYINSNDNYRSNDTVTVRRETNYVGIETLSGIDGFTLSQNIPNPADVSTRIDYSIPEAGEVIFHVHSVSGQLLYSQTIEANNGKQSIELNTSAFAAGIYFYSIEYKNQRLVKRMIVQ